MSEPITRPEPSTKAASEFLLAWQIVKFPSAAEAEKVQIWMLRIEAQAAELERARIRARIEKLEVHEDVWWPDAEGLDVRLLLLDDVLRAVDNPPANEAARKLGEALG